MGFLGLFAKDFAGAVMVESYAEFIRRDGNMNAQRIIHVLLNNLTSTSIKMGMTHANKHVISVRRIYSKLFPPPVGTSSKVAAHRLKLCIRDGRARGAMEELSRISSLADPSIAQLLSYSLLTAMLRGMVQVVHEMLRRGFPANVNTRILGARQNALFPTYFHLALATQDTETIMSFLRRSVDLKETWHGLGPLHLSALLQDTTVLEVLLARGADPLIYTTTTQYSLICRLFASTPDAPRVPVSRPIYAVDIAALAQNRGGLEALMRQAPQSVSHSQLLLHILDDLDLSIRMINLGAEIRSKLPNGSTLLHTKVRAKKPEMLSFYLALGLDVDAKDKKGRSPLEVAIADKDDAAIWVLLLHHAHVLAAFSSDASLLRVQGGAWSPSEDLAEQIRAHKAAASRVEISAKKQRSRFAISRLLYPKKKTLEKSVATLNTKLEKLTERAQKEMLEIKGERIYEIFAQMVSKHPDRRGDDPAGANNSY